MNSSSDFPSRFVATSRFTYNKIPEKEYFYENAFIRGGNQLNK